MTEAAKTVLTAYEVRKSKKQKEAFRAYLCQELEKLGYTPRVESGRVLVMNHNVVAGDPEKAKVLFTAHYDTCAVLPFPNFITPRNLFVYLLYQLALVVLFLVLAVVVEVGLLLAFDPPLWVQMPVLYAVLGFCIWWMLAGKANRHTANDNTSGVVTLLEIAAALPEMFVCAGTVLSVEQAKLAVDCGAKAVISPGTNREVVEWCLKNQVPVYPGCATPTEVEAALGLGLTTVKLFPAEVVGGVKMLKALYGPYRGVKFMPTGGISPSNVKDYLSQPNVIACGGSWLCPAGDINEGNWAAITQRAKECMALVQEVRAGQ